MLIKSILIGFTLVVAHVGWGQTLGVERFAFEPDGRFELDFRAGSESDRESFALEGVTHLGESWTLLGDASLTFLGPDAWRATTDASATMGSRRFFRIRQGGPDLIVSPFAIAGGDLVVNLSQAYRGLLDYRVEFLDNSGRTPLSGQIAVDGTGFVIDLPDLSDGQAGSGLSLALTLNGAEGTFGRFQLGDGRVRTVVVEDDATEWAGLLTPDDDRTELAFQVLILDDQDPYLRTTASQLFPPNPAAGSGGDWPAQADTVLLDGDTFAATFGPVTLAGGTDLAVSLDTELTLELFASGTDVAETSITGIFALETTAPDAPHLNFERRTGSFTLLRVPSVPSDVGL